MKAGGCRRVHLPPFAPARLKWGDEGMEELRGETLVLSSFFYLLLSHYSKHHDRNNVAQSREAPGKLTWHRSSVQNSSGQDSGDFYQRELG